MSDTREMRATLNIVISLLGQFVTLICGLIVPRLMLKYFGSEAYGATASIAQFLAYISLLDGGVGGVARAALYKPLANNDNHKISMVLNEIRSFFRVIGFIFLGYVLILAFGFKYISHIQCFDDITTALLVMAISISTFSEYFFGITNIELLSAAQRTYVIKVVSMGATILNTIATVILVYLNCSLVTVKLVSSICFAIKPIIYKIYVDKYFKLEKINERCPEALEQKWSGLSQHIAYFLHSNTDVAVLTVLSNLSIVAVYSVYNMVISNIQNITNSFSVGMESVFGDMIAKEENDLLKKTFSFYETLISVISLILFSTTAVMILPFVRIYTSGITDVNYIQPLFALLLITASLLFCLRLPYQNIIIAAGHFRETQIAAYGEAIVNIIVSICLVIKFGLVGVAFGTVAAVFFRFGYYSLYLSKNIIYRPVLTFIKRMVINISTFIIIYLLGIIISEHFVISNYFEWAICAIIIFFIAVICVFLITRLFYKEDLSPVINRITKKFIQLRGKLI